MSSPTVGGSHEESHDAGEQGSHDSIDTPTGGVDNKEWEGTIQDNVHHGRPEEVGNNKQRDEPVNAEHAESIDEQAELFPHDEEKGEKDEKEGYSDEEEGYKDEKEGYKDKEEGYKDEEEGYKDEEEDYKDGKEDYKDEEEGYKDGEESEEGLYHDDEYKYSNGEEVHKDKEDNDNYGEEKEDIMHKDDNEDVLHRDNNDFGEGVIMDHTANSASGHHGNKEVELDQQQPPSGSYGYHSDEMHADNKPPPEDNPYTEGDIPGSENIREFAEDEEEDPRVFEEIAKQLAAGNGDLEWEEVYEKLVNQRPDNQVRPDQRQDHQANNLDKSEYLFNSTLEHQDLPGHHNDQDMPDHQDRSDQQETLDQVDQETPDQHSNPDYQIDNQDGLEHQKIPERLHDHWRSDDQVRPVEVADHESLDVHNQQEKLERQDTHGRPEDHSRPDQQDRVDQQDGPDYQDSLDDYVTQLPSYTTSDMVPSLLTTEQVTSSVDQSEYVVSVTMTPVTMASVTMTPVAHEVPITEEPTGGGSNGLEHDEQHDEQHDDDRVVESERVEEIKKDDEIPKHDYEAPKFDDGLPNYRDEIEKHNYGDVNVLTEPGRRDKDEKVEQNGGQNYEGGHIETTTMEEGGKRDVEKDELNSEMQQRDEDLHRDEKNERGDSETREILGGIRENGGEDIEMQKQFERGENNLEIQEKYDGGGEKPEGDTNSLKDTESATFNEHGIHTTQLPHQQHEEDLNAADLQYGHPAHPEHDTQESPQHHYSEGVGVSPDMSEDVVTPSVTMTTSVTHDDYNNQPTVEVYHKPHATHLPSDDVTTHHHGDDITSHHHGDDDDATGMFYDVCDLMCYYDNRAPWLVTRHTSSIPTSWSR